jgi:ADP-sugar diphosphatase
MLVVVVPDDVTEPKDIYDERYAILTVQPRIPAGSLAFVEIPAGMVDDEGSFVGVAAKEMKEELDLEIHESQLICLTELAGAAKGTSEESVEGLPVAMYPSAGGCDEFITIYMYEKRIPRSQLEEWNGKMTGLREHGEKITLKVVPLRDLWREGARDAKCLAALALWEGLKRENKL